MSIEKITPQIAGTLIGQKADLLWDGEFDREGVLVEVQPETPDSNGLGFYCDKMGLLFYPYSDVVFHLRRLESMTEDEARELFKMSKWYEPDKNRFVSCLDWWNRRNLIDDYSNKEIEIGSPASWLYLLSKGFDLFGLIDAGLAKEI